MRRAEAVERDERPLMDLVGRGADVLQPESDLGLDAGKDDLVLRILEGDRDGARKVARLRAAGVTADDLHSPGEETAVEVRHEPGEGPQQRRLARSGRAEQADELARPDVEGNVLERRSSRPRIGVREVLDPG